MENCDQRLSHAATSESGSFPGNGRPKRRWQATSERLGHASRLERPEHSRPRTAGMVSRSPEACFSEQAFGRDTGLGAGCSGRVILEGDRRDTELLEPRVLKDRPLRAFDVDLEEINPVDEREDVDAFELDRILTIVGQSRSEEHTSELQSLRHL